MLRTGGPPFHANLSPMLPALPRALNPDFVPNPELLSSTGRDAGLQDSDPVDHHCQICPTCGHRLTGHHCKLVCTQCGYYLSCADYY